MAFPRRCGVCGRGLVMVGSRRARCPAEEYYVSTPPGWVIRGTPGTTRWRLVQA